MSPDKTTADSHTAKTLSAIEAVSFRSSGQLGWMGIPLRIPVPDAAITRALLLEQLAALLYQQFYCHGRVVPFPSEPVPKSPLTSREVELLTTAQGRRFRWEDGWKVNSVEQGFLDAERGGLRALVNPEAWRSRKKGHAEVRFRSGSFALSPGFFLVTAGEPFTEQEVVRVYWNVTLAAAARIISALASSLGRHSISYQVKASAQSFHAGRTDSCVLYLQKTDFAQAAPWLLRIYESVARSARSAVPVYSLEIAAGMAVAEQPRERESFGQHRSRILAEGMLLASDAGAKSARDRLTEVREHFSRCGYSLDRPYVNPGSTFDPLASFARAPRVPVPWKNGLRGGRKSFLELAVQIGEELVRAAVWHADRCNWLGSQIVRGHIFASLGPDLYSGTSGIAWFLAELFRVTRNEEFRRTAEGAIRQSWEAADKLTATLGKGLYSGWMGVAYAGWRCALLLERAELYHEVERTLVRLRKTSADVEIPDVISGEAGAILALLSMNDEAAVSLTCLYGCSLLRTAKRSGEVWSWRTTGRPRHPHLTGFAHGTAGIGTALFALYLKTGQPQFLEAARGAFLYERDLFSERERNWPDFRGVGNRREPRQYFCAWCHGAPGIALSRRLAKYKLESTGDCEHELEIALETTRTALVTGLSRDQDFCLCHGMAGNADILQLAGSESDRSLIEQVGWLGVERYRSVVRGSEGGFVGLMTGIAGIGHFYLRLHDQIVPSSLWIGPRFE